MRSATFSGDGRIEIAAVDIMPPASGEVRVRVGACCLCGSDLRPWRQGWPVTPGHEIAGWVDQPGHPRHGEAVAVYIPVFCGSCQECEAGHTNLCRNMTDLIGWQRPGGYAEALTVPDQCLLPLPDDIPIASAPLLLDTVGTAAHGIRLARQVIEDGAALVLGAGPIGLGALILLRRFGFDPVYVVEPQAVRRQIAAELGGHRVAPEALAARYPLVIEASGKDAARQTALDRVAPRGCVVQLGEADRWSIEETRPIRRKDFFLIRSFYFARPEWEANIDLFRADRASYERLIDAQTDLSGLPGLFQEFARGERIKPAYVPHPNTSP
jgi:threonine dehydrogenase-like Zn-dependent dehydrogenase